MQIINKINTYKKRIAKIVGYDLIEEVDYRYITLFIKIFRDFNIEGVEFHIWPHEEFQVGYILAKKGNHSFSIQTFEMDSCFDVHIGRGFINNKKEEFNNIKTIAQLKKTLTDYFNTYK